MKHKAINRTPVSEIIKERMKARGMSQAELSALTGISPAVINYLVNGQRGLTPKQIVVFALILGFDAIELGRMQSDQEIMAIINPMIIEEE